MPETGFKSSDIRAVLSSKLFKVLHCKIKKFAILLIILRTMLNCRVRDVSPYQFQPHGRVRGVRRSVSGGRSVRTSSLDLLPPHSPAVCCSQSWRCQILMSLCQVNTLTLCQDIWPKNWPPTQQKVHWTLKRKLFSENMIWSFGFVLNLIECLNSFHCLCFEFRQ